MNMTCRQWFAAMTLCVVSVFTLAGENVADGNKTVAETPVKVSSKESPYTSLLTAKSSRNNTNNSSVGTGLVTADPVKVIAGLLFVVAIILVVAWLARRVGAIPALAGQSIRVVSALSVGTREKVVLIDVGGQQVLLGVAPGRVNHLQTFEQPVLDKVAASKPLANEFSNAIKKFLQPNSGDVASVDEKTISTERSS